VLAVHPPPAPAQTVNNNIKPTAAEATTTTTTPANTVEVITLVGKVAYQLFLFQSDTLTAATQNRLLHFE